MHLLVSQTVCPQATVIVEEISQIYLFISRALSFNITLPSVPSLSPPVFHALRTITPDRIRTNAFAIEHMYTIVLHKRFGPENKTRQII